MLLSLNCESRAFKRQRHRSRGASSAGRKKSLILRASSPCNGCEKAQQRYHALGCGAAREAPQDRARKLLLIDRRHEVGTLQLPERGFGESLAPPQPPARNGAAVNPELMGKAGHPLFWTRSARSRSKCTRS